MDKTRIQLTGVLDQVMSNLREQGEAISDAIELPDGELLKATNEPLHQFVRQAAAGYTAMLTSEEIARMPLRLLHWWVLQPHRQRLSDMVQVGIIHDDLALYRVVLAAVLAELRLMAAG